MYFIVKTSRIKKATLPNDTEPSYVSVVLPVAGDRHLTRNKVENLESAFAPLKGCKYTTIIYVSGQTNSAL